MSGRSTPPRLLGLNPAIKSEKFRFLAVGAWNTLVAYLVFLVVNALIGDLCASAIVLIVSYCISLPHAFITQRMWVFHTHGPWRRQFARFVSANSFIFVANLIFLPAAIAATGANPAVAQACFVLISVVTSYFLHKHFSFAR